MAVDIVREQQAIRRLTDGLLAAYGATHSTDQVNAAVENAVQRFAGHPVREFVPILIERLARKELDSYDGTTAPATVSAAPGETPPVEAVVPAEAAPAEPATPAESSPAEPASAPAPAEASPVEATAPVEAAPVEPTAPAEADSVDSVEAAEVAAPVVADGLAEASSVEAVAPVAAGAPTEATASTETSAPEESGDSTEATTVAVTDDSTVTSDSAEAAAGDSAEVDDASAADDAATTAAADSTDTGASTEADNSAEAADSAATVALDKSSAADPAAPTAAAPTAAAPTAAAPTAAAPTAAAPTAAAPTAAAPTASSEGSGRVIPMPSRRTALVLGGAAAVAAVVAVAVGTRRGDSAPAVAAGASGAPAPSAPTAVRGVVGSEKMAFFQDARVVDALASHGVRVDVEAAGSRQIATTVDLGAFDFAFPSSAPAAERILRARNITAKYTPFSSPMAIATFQPIADLLTAARVVKPGKVPTFDIARYLELVKANTEWAQLPDNSVYPVRKNILVSTTDPRTSNSAAMYLSIASFVANDNAIVQGGPAEQAVLPTVSKLFVGQGYTENTTDGPFQEYLNAGMGATPLVLIYEAQFVEATARGQVKPGMVLTYPSPTVLSKHTLVPLRPAGDQVGRLLSTDPTLRRLAAEHGFRTGDAAEFAKATTGMPVAADVIDVVDTPTYDTLEHLLDGVSKTYN